MPKKEPDWEALKKVATATEKEYRAGTLTRKRWEGFYAEARNAVGDYDEFLECVINFAPSK